MAGCCELGNELSDSLKCGDFFFCTSDFWFVLKGSGPCAKRFRVSISGL